MLKIHAVNPEKFARQDCIPTVNSTENRRFLRYYRKNMLV
jgi:hypothetical protein